MMNPLGHKLNNSYESEQSSSNGSINEATASETSATTPPLNLPELFGVDRTLKMNVMESGSDNNKFRVSAPEFDYDSELAQYSNTFSSAEISDQNERVYKELDKIKMTKILKTLTSNQPASSGPGTVQENLYGQNIDKSPSIVYNMENSCNASDNKIVSRTSVRKHDRNLTFKLNIEEISRRNRAATTSSSITTRSSAAKKTPIKRREQSPDLFDDYSDSDQDTNADVAERMEHAATKDTSDKVNSRAWEKTLLKRLQASLCGVLPPPSKTIIQYNSTELLDLYNENLIKMATCNDAAKSDNTESLSKPTHTVDEVKNIEWNDMGTDIKCHGLLYNRTTDSEDIELLCMKYAERCVGVETSSSFTHTYRPSANKIRMQLLSQSPGTRLSHLVGRRKGLSSATLLSKPCGSDSSKLGSKQLVIDVQKNFSRRRKVTTPKRRTPAKKRIPGRKTPGSSRKRAILSAKSKIPTRETSKRALFQSPPQQKPKPTIPIDVARRVDKSKRMLFSPSSDERDSKSTNCFSQPIGKRRRDEDGLLGNQSKLPRLTGPEDVRNSRTMFAKSQTFCVTKTTGNEAATAASSVQRARSEVTLNGSQQLSQSHRRKLLWAVSTSLRKKNISAQHPNFTAFASVLAKVVKRLFLETRDESASTSDTMIRIADRLVFWVVQGKSVDEIYLNEKIRKENLRAATKIKLKGYIAPEDYEKLKKPIQKVNSNMFLSQSSTDSFNFSEQSFNLDTQSSLSQNTEGLLSDLSLSSNCFNEIKSVGTASEPVNYARGSSSSKSNTSGSVLRENVRESELKQKSGQKVIEFSGRDQKNVSPYHDINSKFAGGGLRTNIMNVKRQISFDA